MKCESCGDKDATVHFTEIRGSEKKETHLCEECARSKTGPFQKAVSLSDILNSLLSHLGGKEIAEMEDVKCDSCGMTHAEFRSSGRLGCPKDYEVFDKSLGGLLEKIHHGTKHIGKVPSGAGKDLVRDHLVLKLRQELERAAQREEYEKAAEYRDQIRQLTQESDDDS